MIPLALQGGAIRLGEDGGHLIRFQVAKRPPSSSFRGDSEHFGTLCGCQRFAISQKAVKTAQSRQSAVPCPHRDFTFLLAVLKKSDDLWELECSH
jgi:hypothetical protein